MKRERCQHRAYRTSKLDCRKSATHAVEWEQCGGEIIFHERLFCEKHAVEWLKWLKRVALIDPSAAMYPDARPLDAALAGSDIPSSGALERPAIGENT